MEDLEAAIRSLNALQSTGIQLSIDDFGTGYSSLSYLYRLPVDTLKIDRSFVSRMGAGDEREMVGTIVALAHSLHGRDGRRRRNRRAASPTRGASGCEYVQGFYFSRPVDVAAADGLIASQPWHDAASWKSPGSADLLSRPSARLSRIHRAPKARAGPLRVRDMSRA